MILDVEKKDERILRIRVNSLVKSSFFDQERCARNIHSLHLIVLSTKSGILI